MNKSGVTLIYLAFWFIIEGTSLASSGGQGRITYFDDFSGNNSRERIWVYRQNVVLKKGANQLI